MGVSVLLSDAELAALGSMVRGGSVTDYSLPIHIVFSLRSRGLIEPDEYGPVPVLRWRATPAGRVAIDGDV